MKSMYCKKCKKKFKDGASYARHSAMHDKFESERAETIEMFGKDGCKGKSGKGYGKDMSDDDKDMEYEKNMKGRFGRLRKMGSPKGKKAA